MNGPEQPKLGGVALPEQLEPAPWYVVKVYSPFGADYRVFNKIVAETGLRAHLPQIAVYRPKFKHGRPYYENGKRVEEEAIRPLFPGYLFVSFELRQPGWGRIHDVDGVQHIMCRRTEQGSVPIRLPMGLVEALQARGRAGDGVIDDRKPAFPLIQPGAAVKVKDGALESFEGIFKLAEGDRVTVLLAMFGGEREVQMDRSSVVEVVR